MLAISSKDSGKRAYLKLYPLSSRSGADSDDLACELYAYGLRCEYPPLVFDKSVQQTRSGACQWHVSGQKEYGNLLPTPARTKQDDLRKVIIHAPQFLSHISTSPSFTPLPFKKNKPDCQPFPRTRRSPQTTVSVAPSWLIFSTTR
jgi:hypothetical protein